MILGRDHLKTDIMRLCITFYRENIHKLIPHTIKHCKHRFFITHYGEKMVKTSYL
jgi:hypothetical protein